jgi:hypothetical protein
MLQSSTIQPAASRPAVVSKAVSDGAQYLRVTEDGRNLWVADPASATPFGSMREATRMAIRLPAGLRAFGMPLQIELETYQLMNLH